MEAVILKLIQHLQSLEEGLKLIQVKNNDLWQCTEEKKAKKKYKWNMLSTESVLTLKAIKELTATKEAT